MAGNSSFFARYASGLALAFGLAGQAVGGPLEDGQAAYLAGDFSGAMRIWRPLATRGNAEAQLDIGMMFNSGLGVPKDYAQAVYWYGKAAKQDIADAQSLLADMYMSGHGVPRDFVTAALWYQKAATHGTPDAQCNLARLYEKEWACRETRCSPYLGIGRPQPTDL